MEKKPSGPRMAIVKFSELRKAKTLSPTQILNDPAIEKTWISEEPTKKEKTNAD
jgi:hypothetical protein